MCKALDMPCGARRDLDQIEAKLYRMAQPYIEFAPQIYRQAPGLQPGAFSVSSQSKKSAPINDFFVFTIAHPSLFCYNYQKMIYNGCVLL